MILTIHSPPELIEQAMKNSVVGSVEYNRYKKLLIPAREKDLKGRYLAMLVGKLNMDYADAMPIVENAAYFDIYTFLNAMSE